MYDIKETNKFKDALTEIHFDTCLLLDLDNTIMTSQIDFGGDAWFEGLFSHVKQKGIEPAVANSALMSVYNTAQHFVRTKAIEPNIVTIIKALQDIGIPVIGLTARGHIIRHQTLRQLATIGIDFSRNSIIPDDEVSCQGGIIFCAGGDKGDHLKAVLSRSSHKPKHMVMLDDKKKHLERVMIALKALGIRFTGLRYGYLDEHVKQFSMETANRQLAHLWQWLSAEVRADVSTLKLLSEELKGALNPLVYSEHFFHPDQPLHPVSVDEKSSQGACKSRKRSASAAGFFDVEPAKLPKRSASAAELTMDSKSSLEQDGLRRAIELFDLSTLDKKEHIHEFYRVAKVLENPLCQIIFDARRRVFSDYASDIEPITPSHADAIITQLKSDPERNIHLFFDFFAAFRPCPPSQKYRVEVDVPALVNRALTHFCSNIIAAIKNREDCSQAQEMISTLRTKGGNKKIFNEIKYGVASFIESQDFYSLRNYSDLMNEIWSVLKRPQVDLPDFTDELQKSQGYWPFSADALTHQPFFGSATDTSDKEEANTPVRTI